MPRAWFTNTPQIFPKDFAFFKSDMHWIISNLIIFTIQVILFFSFNVFYKWYNTDDAELKRDRFIVTELIHTITLNNALKAAQLAIVYIKNRYA